MNSGLQKLVWATVLRDKVVSNGLKKIASSKVSGEL